MPEYRFRGELGIRDAWRGALSLNQPIVDDRFAIRFSAEKRADDGYVDNPTLNSTYNARESETYRLKGTWAATDTLDIRFGYTYAESFGGEYLINSTEWADRRVNFSNEPADEGSKHNLFDLRATWEIQPGLTFDSETNLYNHDYRRREDGTTRPTRC